MISILFYRGACCIFINSLYKINMQIIHNRLRTIKNHRQWYDCLRKKIQMKSMNRGYYGILVKYISGILIPCSSPNWKVTLWSIPGIGTAISRSVYELLTSEFGPFKQIKEQSWRLKRVNLNKLLEQKLRQENICFFSLRFRYLFL